MRDFLDFAFAGFWHFVGVLILVTAVFSGLADIISALRGRGVTVNVAEQYRAITDDIKAKARDA